MKCKFSLPKLVKHPLVFCSCLIIIKGQWTDTRFHLQEASSKLSNTYLNMIRAWTSMKLISLEEQPCTWPPILANTMLLTCFWARVLIPMSRTRMEWVRCTMQRPVASCQSFNSWMRKEKQILMSEMIWIEQVYWYFISKVVIWN